MALLAVAFALAAGCGKKGPAGEGQPGARARYLIGISQCSLDDPWRAQMNADVQKAAEQHNQRVADDESVELLFKDAQNDTSRQRADVEELLAAKVSLLMVSPKEAQPSLTDPVARAYQAGIPVILLDRALIGDKYTCLINADNTKIGRAAGEWIAKRLNRKGLIVELKGRMTSEPAKQRHDGFQEAVKREPDLRVIYEADMEWLEEKAKTEMASALARFDKIDAVFAHSDAGAHGAYQAAKAAGREKDIVFVGIGALPPEGIAYVSQGTLSASFQYPTGGAEAIGAAIKALKGEKVPKQIELRSRVFTKENVARGGQPLE